MIRLHFLALALALTTACDQPDDGTDASTGASSTSDAASTGPELDVLAASTGDDTTGDASDTTGDEGSGGFGGSGGDVCSCDPGQVCATHPVTHEWMCVAPCGPSLVCDPVGVLEFECVTVGGLGLCFPIV